MTKRITTMFPLEHPTHYVACIADDVTGDCAHVSVKLTFLTLVRLLWMCLAASALRLVGIKTSVFGSNAGALGATCLRSKGKQTLRFNQETSTDDDPYNCLSPAELISLGGYATEAVLSRYFALAKRDLKVDVIDVHVAGRTMWFKLHFVGTNPCLETDPFNLGIIVKDFIRRNLPKGGRYAKTSK